MPEVPAMPMVRYPAIETRGEPTMVIPPHFVSLTFMEGSQNPTGECEYPEGHWQNYLFKAGQKFAKKNPGVKLG